MTLQSRGCQMRMVTPLHVALRSSNSYRLQFWGTNQPAISAGFRIPWNNKPKGDRGAVLTGDILGNVSEKVLEKVSQGLWKTLPR